jgi:hypothetical protein
MYLPSSFNGFMRIGEDISHYSGANALFLESNCISEIENLEGLVELTSLFVQKNKIHQVQNLSALQQLRTLNLSENCIERVEGIEDLPNLGTLNLAGNRLASLDSIEKLQVCVPICCTGPILTVHGYRPVLASLIWTWGITSWRMLA